MIPMQGFSARETILQLLLLDKPAAGGYDLLLDDP
jgi:hypothetical protein